MNWYTALRGRGSFNEICLLLVACAIGWGCTGPQVECLGINWGTLSSHPLPSPIVVNMLQANNISKVKLFDADPNVLRAFAGSDIEVTVAIPNDMLEVIATSTDAANRWVRDNVTQYLVKGGVNIRYVAVGNEPFLTAYSGAFQNVTVPALENIQNSLLNANLANQVKATVPLNADVLTSDNSMLPSAGMFRDDIQPQMKELLSLLDKNQAPFTINIYPYLSLQQNPNFPKDFAFFDGSTHAVVDGSHVYNNVLDAIYDLLVAALNRTGFPNMPIFVGEIGWPTDGDLNANVASAQKFNQELLKHVLSNIGTPLRPGAPLEVYLFALMDEDQKSVAPGNFEPHWGIFTFDGQPKYPLDLTGQGRNVSLTKASDVRYLTLRWCVLNPDGDMSKLAENVAYACTHADCTPLTYGSSCNSMGVPGNASYAFNRYYQLTNQAGNSCYFEGLGMVTSVDPSTSSCRFLIELALSSAPFRPPASLTIPFAGVIALLFLWI